MPFSPLLAESTWLGPAMFALGCAGLTAILLRTAYRRLGKRKRGGGSGPHIEAQARPTSTWDGAKQDAHARLSRQEVELHEMARDLTGQIDSKLILFQQLVAQSQQQIERLEALLREAETKREERGDEAHTGG
ncbi:MAG: hypothetical protein AAF266_01565 [Planctomycetota bacterium]